MLRSDQVPLALFLPLAFYEETFRARIGSAEDANLRAKLDADPSSGKFLRRHVP